jgi:hypothetical protein
LKNVDEERKMHLERIQRYSSGRFSPPPDFNLGDEMTREEIDNVSKCCYEVAKLDQLMLHPDAKDIRKETRLDPEKYAMRSLNLRWKLYADKDLSRVKEDEYFTKCLQLLKSIWLSDASDISSKSIDIASSSSITSNTIGTDRSNHKHPAGEVLNELDSKIETMTDSMTLNGLTSSLFTNISLLRTIEVGSPDAVKNLIQQGIDPTPPQGEERKTVLHRCVDLNRFDMAEAMLQSASPDMAKKLLEAEDAVGRTAVDLAIDQGRYKLLTLFIDSGGGMSKKQLEKVEDRTQKKVLKAKLRNRESSSGDPDSDNQE